MVKMHSEDKFYIGDILIFNEDDIKHNRMFLKQDSDITCMFIHMNIDPEGCQKYQYLSNYKKYDF